MTEAFINYVWQFQYFNKKELKTPGGEWVEVFKPGTSNNNGGPDFYNAHIRIGGMDWVGTVEIHPRSSGWLEHHHDRDPAYENVILHVVWEDDKPIRRSDQTVLPTIELRNRVPQSLVNRYRQMINTSFSIPCRKSFGEVDTIIKRSMIERALVQRLETKAARVMHLHRQYRGDWQQTAFVLLARNFGFKINSDPFLQLAQSLPYKTLLKHSDQPHQLEALLFGQAGFLDIEPGDDYYQLLRREYRLLGMKYGLFGKKLERAQWRFLRMRPANFPTLRLAQLASVVSRQRNVCSHILEDSDPRSLRELFSTHPSAYWQSHYHFNRKAREKISDLGSASIDNILINTVAPLLVAYGRYTDQAQFIDRALHLLMSIPAESNSIIRNWIGLGYHPQGAFDSQGLIELYQGYCQQRNCLNCAIGAFVLKPVS